MGQIAGLIFDIDGTVARGRQAIAGVPETLQALRADGYRVAFCTQEHREPPAGVAARLQAAGIAAQPEEIVTAGAVALDYVQRRCPGARVYVVGPDFLTGELHRREITTVDAPEADTANVVLLGHDESFTYQKLMAASQAVWNGARLLATHHDRYLPVEHGRVPTTGAMTQAVAFATRSRPLVLGKPSVWMMRMALQVLGLSPEAVAVVGDTAETDIRMGKRAGCRTVLVFPDGGTGDTAQKHPPGIPATLQPDAILPDVTHLPAWLEAGAYRDTLVSK